MKLIKLQWYWVQLHLTLKNSQLLSKMLIRVLLYEGIYMTALLEHFNYHCAKTREAPWSILYATNFWKLQSSL